MGHLTLAGRAGMAAAAIVLCATTVAAQNTSSTCGTAAVIPRTSAELPAKIVIDPPLAEPLATRGVVIIQYCAQNVHIVPVFGPNTQTVSPRIGHIHVRVDDASWVWADASGTPIILQGLTPGQHRVSIDLVDANHHTLDQGTITFVVPEKPAAKHS